MSVGQHWFESLGYTTQERDILETYCNTSIDALTMLSSPLSLSTEKNNGS